MNQHRRRVIDRDLAGRLEVGLHVLGPGRIVEHLVPSDRREEPHGGRGLLAEPGSMCGVVRHDEEPAPERNYRGCRPNGCSVAETELVDT